MWVAITLLATCFQILRTSEQHRLRGLLGVAEAGYVRFVYALPVVATATALWMSAGPGTLPSLNTRFFVSLLVGGSAQILATMALLHAFRIRDFAVGTLYSKTEPIFVGSGSALFLGEALPLWSWIGIVICLAGVGWLASGGRRDTLKFEKAAVFGSIAGLGFGTAAVGIRSASTAINGTVVDRAMITLCVMLAIQTVIQGTALALSPSSSLRRVAGAWRNAIGVALLSLAGSFSWAIAITLENAARVRTLAQIEIVMAFAIGVIVHRETHKRSEYIASMVAGAGILLLLLS